MNRKILKAKIERTQSNGKMNILSAPSSALIRSPWSYVRSVSTMIQVSALLVFMMPHDAEARKKVAEPVVPLTEQGELYLAEYTNKMKALQSEIIKSLPKIDAAKESAYKKAREAEVVAIAELDKARKGQAEIDKWKKHINDFNVKWIPLSQEQLNKAKQALLAATKEGKAAAEAAVAKAEKDLEKTKAGLADRHKKLALAQKRYPNNAEILMNAEVLVPKTEAATQQALKQLHLTEVLKSDQWDEQLATYYIMHHATARGLATFAQKGAKEKKLIDDMLANRQLMVEIAIADGANTAKYGEAMEILEKIQAYQGKTVVTPALKNLALAIALELSVPVKLRNAVSDTEAPEYVDPLKRYLAYEKAFHAKKLDPGFAKLSVWDMRMVVNGNEPDHIAEWGREMLANYRPDHILTDDERWRYVDLVRTDIRYGSQDNKFDQDELQFFQNILKNGGICGRRAFIGRFILRAFGVPVTGRPQPGHAALTHWTSDGWVVCLGAGWGKGTTHTPYKADLDFLATTQARAQGQTYKQVARGHWIGSVFGETRAHGFLTDKENVAFWNSIGLYRQNELIADAEALAAVGEDIGEANQTKEKVEIIKVKLGQKDREVKLAANGVITIPAAATRNLKESTDKVIFMPSNQGGLQLHYSRIKDPQPLEYAFHAPVAGEYSLTAKVVTPSWKQKLMISVNAKGEEVELELPHTVGMWAKTAPVKVRLQEGENALTFNHKTDGYAKGFSIHRFELTPIK